MRATPPEMDLATTRQDESSASSPALVPTWLATPGRFIALLGVLFAVQVIVRTMVSPVAGLDESEQLVFSQSWQWGYGPQPPLYTWLQILVFKCLSPSILGLAVLKNALLFGTYAFTYASARIVTRTHAGGLLAALALLFIPQIAWESQRDLTHSVLATTVASVTLFIFLKLQQTGARGLYLLLGIAFGFGLLSNYNYALLIAGLLIGALCLKEFRPLVLTPWLLVSLAIMLALVLPHALWAKEHAAVVFSTAHKLRIQSDASPLLSGLRAVANLAGAWLSHVISIVLVFLVLCWKELIPLPRPVFARAPIRFLLFVLASALACVLVTMLATGATWFKGRWLQPIFFCVPILLAALIHERLTARAARRIVHAALAVAVAVMAALTARVSLLGRFGRVEELNALSPELAGQLRGEAERARAIVTDTFFVAGNLRLIFPGKPVITPQFDQVSPDGKGAGALAVFNATFDSQPPADLKRLAAGNGLDMANIRYIAATGSSRKKAMRLGVATD